MQAFLDGALPWISIPDVLSGVLDRHDGAVADSVESVVDADRRAREVARQLIQREEISV